MLSQIVFQGQNYTDLAVYTVDGGRVYALQLTAPAQVFAQLQPLFQGLLGQVQLAGGSTSAPLLPGYPASPPGMPETPGYPMPGPGGTGPGMPSLPPSPTLTAAQPSFTPPADRVVQLRYGKEVGDGRQFAVALGGLYYRIEPAGNGRWRVTEVVEDTEGKSEETYLLDGLGLEEGKEVLLPPVWHTGRTNIGGDTFARVAQGDLILYSLQDEKNRIEIAYRKDGWLAYFIYCDFSKPRNPCTRYSLKEVR
ncbi:hypothetical protein [Thermus albus]|uniref:hypothetical protein n=1 Tax=Thermus albus TaxID=2908146 RepID=UPI001FAA0945|nr:hypothetical protein [Thermus albus]